MRTLGRRLWERDRRIAKREREYQAWKADIEVECEAERVSLGEMEYRTSREEWRWSEIGWMFAYKHHDCVFGSEYAPEFVMRAYINAGSPIQTSFGDGMHCPCLNYYELGMRADSMIAKAERQAYRKQILLQLLMHQGERRDLREELVAEGKLRDGGIY